MRYQGRERERCLAFLINQLRSRAGFGGVILSPGVIKSLLALKPDALMAAAWESAAEPLTRELLDSVGELIEKVRNAGELLGNEDIFELEHGTALHGFGQRLALRQVLQAAERLCESLPHQRPRESPRRHQVATKIVAEDTYPIGGFSSISNKGSLESLLHSQLAYIEPDDRPDLFDVKFLRDELLFYSRDENQFLRQRRTFVFALYPDLAEARVKDAELPWQRVILLLATLYAAVNRLIEWLSDDSLTFHLAFLRAAGTKQLSDEQTLLETLFREQIDNGTVTISEMTSDELIKRCRECSVRSQTYCITIGAANRSVRFDNTLVTRIRLRSAVVEYASEDEAFATSDQPGVAGWQLTLATLLQEWS